MARTDAGIGDLDAIVARLPQADRDLFGRIYDVTVVEGSLLPTNEMKPWIEDHFGSVDRVLNQRIVRVANRLTLEESVFNPLRASRPMSGGGGPGRCVADAPEGDDPFRDPLATTPEDTFGRVRGRFCISASNVAKCEGFHGLLVFEEPAPLEFTRDQVVDYVETAWRWALEAHSCNAAARYFLFLWNCGPRAGASQSHGHAQVLLGRYRHYAKVELLLGAASRYRDLYRASYFEDLYKVHEAIGCGFERAGVRVMASLTPVKEKEMVVMAPDVGPPLAETVYEVLACFRDRMGVESFNVALFTRPLGEEAEHWTTYPTVARIVDRGSPATDTCDIGGMELYGASVISSDPFEVAEAMGEAMA